jgi:hypothetical protein
MPDESRPGADGLRPGADAKPSARSTSAITNKATARWNGNTKHGRRCRDLYEAFLKRSGSPADADTQAAILAVAEKVVLAEIAREDCLKGMNAFSVELVVRLENLAARSLRTLKLDKVPTAPRKSLADRLKEQAAARQAAADAPPDGGAT